MPQRTNDFQKLVDIIQRKFAPAGSKITSSAMVTAADGSQREVDILIESALGIYPFKIAIEAKDHGRALDVTAIEAMVGKYNAIGGIIVNKVVIVAHAFSANAVKRAGLLGYELHTLNTLQEINSGQFVRELGNSSPKPNNAGWWVSDAKNQERRVELSIIGRNGKSLPKPYLQGTILNRKTKIPVSTPTVWARQIIDNSLGQQVDDLYEEYAGSVLRIIAEVEFSDHLIRRQGLSEIQLTKMSFDFGERMKIPNVEPSTLELKLSEARSKKIIHEKGRGKMAEVSIVYEQEQGGPKSIYFHSSDTEKKLITINLGT